MLLITVNEDGTVDVATDIEPVPYVVVINVAHEFTDSPVVTAATEDEMVEWLMAHRNEGFEDRNP